MRDGKVAEALVSQGPQGSEVEYEPPRLTAIGNLHDLLAGHNGSTCDGDLSTSGRGSVCP
jgi:hypothetical protein